MAKRTKAKPKQQRSGSSLKKREALRSAGKCLRLKGRDRDTVEKNRKALGLA